MQQLHQLSTVMAIAGSLSLMLLTTEINNCLRELKNKVEQSEVIPLDAHGFSSRLIDCSRMQVVAAVAIMC